MKQLTSIFFFLCLAFSMHLQAQTLSIQGVVKNSDGTAAEDGDYSITFRLYTVETGGSNVWEETQNDIEVKGGTYSALLGSSTSFPAFTEPAYYLGISIEGGQELQPRSQLTAAPFALSLIGDDNIFPNTGNVGIGTNDPQEKIHVIGDMIAERATSTVSLDLKNNKGTWSLQGAHNRANNPLELEFNNGAQFEFFDDGGLAISGGFSANHLTAEKSNAGTASMEVKNTNGTWTFQGPHNRANFPLELDFNGARKFEFFNNGDFCYEGTTYSCSDRRLKRDIKPITSSLSNISQLNGYTYHWKDSTKSQLPQIGVIAQELQVVYPELVIEKADGMLSVNYEGLVPVLIEATKEQQSEIENLQNQMDMLAAQNEKTSDQLGMLLWLLGGLVGLLALLALGYVMMKNGMMMKGARKEWQVAMES